MPETTETETFPQPATEIFDLVVDLRHLPEWDPMFERAERLDDGPLGVGSRFQVHGSVPGRDFELEMEIVEYDRPNRALIRGHGEGIETVEDVTVRTTEDGTELTYRSAFETSLPAAVDAAAKPAFVVAGKRAIAGLRDRTGR